MPRIAFFIFFLLIILLCGIVYAFFYLNPTSYISSDTTIKKDFVVNKDKTVVVKNGAKLTVEGDAKIEGILKCEGGPIYLTTKKNLTVDGSIFCNLNNQEIKNAALLRKIKGKSLFWGALNFIDAHLQYWLSKIIFPNQILIFDRYFYDFLPTFSYYKIGFQSFFIKLIPDIEYKFILLCSPRIIYKRKFENLPEYYNLAYALYQKYIKQFSLTPLHTEKLSPPELLKKVLNNLCE